jgi:TonB family protein
VVNGKATSLPKPKYPEAARQAKISGMVGVNVIIDEAGIVISAEADVNDQRERFATDGSKLEPVPLDPSLREASEAAARQATFSPTLLSGQPVKVRGKIVYNFVAGGDEAVKVIQGGVLNGKAISLPMPAYPETALAAKAQGVITVQVTIDEEGNVISANAVSGHPLFRAAAETAALEAKFSPTLLQGAPVRVTGVLTYNFVP